MNNDIISKLIVTNICYHIRDFFCFLGLYYGELQLEMQFLQYISNSQICRLQCTGLPIRYRITLSINWNKYVSFKLAQMPVFCCDRQKRSFSTTKPCLILLIIYIFKPWRSLRKRLVDKMQPIFRPWNSWTTSETIYIFQHLRRPLIQNLSNPICREFSCLKSLYWNAKYKGNKLTLIFWGNFVCDALHLV